MAIRSAACPQAPPPLLRGLARAGEALTASLERLQFGYQGRGETADYWRKRVKRHTSPSKSGEQDRMRAHGIGTVLGIGERWNAAINQRRLPADRDSRTDRHRRNLRAPDPRRQGSGGDSGAGSGTQGKGRRPKNPACWHETAQDEISVVGHRFFRQLPDYGKRVALPVRGFHHHEYGGAD